MTHTKRLLFVEFGGTSSSFLELFVDALAAPDSRTDLIVNFILTYSLKFVMFVLFTYSFSLMSALLYFNALVE